MNGWEAAEAAHDDLIQGAGPATAWHTIYIWTDSDGEGATVSHATNDDEDRGYQTTFEQWSQHYSNIDDAMRHAGVSRVGVSGVVVSVYLDGTKI